MANEFKIKKGLIVTGASGGTVVDIQGSQGQLFSVTDNLTGSIFAVSDISGVPIMDVNSSGLSTFDGTVEIGTSTVATANAAADDLWLRSTGSNGITISSGNAQTGTIFFGDEANAAVAGFRYNHNTGDMAITAEDNITFACDKVGIGTTDPDHTLMIEKDVDGDWEALRLFNYHSDGSTVGSVAINMDVRASNGQIARASIKSKESTADSPYSELGFFTSNTTSTAPSERMTIDKDGNVGIGTTSPATELQIGDYTDATETITIATSNNGAGRINFYDQNDTEGGSIRVVGQNLGSKMYFSNRWNTDNDRVVFDLTTGNVGIGITNPGYPIHAQSANGSTWMGYFYNTSANGTGVHVETNASGTEPALRVSSIFGGSNNAGLQVLSNGNSYFGRNITTPTQDLSTTATPTNFGVYTSEIRLIETPNGGLKQCRVITDNYGEWILVGRFAANARQTIQGTWSSVSGLTTGDAQNETTEFSSDFGDSFPTEVRIMGATDFTKWRDTRTVDFVYGVPEGRPWKYFFSGGVENGMAVSTKYGWGINGAYDGFGRWVNPAQNFVRMSDGNVTNPSAAYTTATANAFNWEGAADAKITVSATRVFSGQDTYVTAGFGNDDNLQGFFDVYPNETNNMQGGTAFSSAVWVLIKLPNASSGGSSGNHWSSNGTDINNNNSGNVGIGTTSPNYKLDVEGDISLVGSGENYAIMSPIAQGMQIAVGDPADIATPLVTFDGANQRVGIGTTNPSEKLEVAGKVYIESQGVNWNETTPGLAIGTQHFDPVGSGVDHTGNAITFGASDSGSGATAQAGIYTRSDGTYGTKMYFATTDSYATGSKTSMMIDYNGNVGIGVTNPNTKLQVAGIAQIVESGNIAFYGGNYVRVFGDQNYGFRNTAGTYIANISMSGNSYFNGGNVGIGTTGPGQKLDVVGGFIRSISTGANLVQGAFVAQSSTTDSPGYRGQGYFTYNEELDVSWYMGTPYTNGDMFSINRQNTTTSFDTGAANMNGTNVDNFFAIKNNGYVGIGTTGPASKLEVNGTINFNSSGDRGFICNPGGGTFSLGDIDDVAGGAYINGDGTYINYYAGGVITGRLEDDGTLTVTGDMVAYGSPSDKRLKENIKPIESALDKAMKLQGVTFDWKESDSLLDIKEDIGFIAQDVQKVVPELVRENDNGMLSMRHQGIAPILLEAIKELKAEIDLLKSKPCTCNKCNCNI